MWNILRMGHQYQIGGGTAFCTPANELLKGDVLPCHALWHFHYLCRSVYPHNVHLVADY